MILRDDKGDSVRLGPSGPSGGEGTIHTVDSHRVAKIFHRHRVTQELERKLRAMAAAPPDDPALRDGHRSIAWVERILYDHHGGLAGFTMPAVDTTTFGQAHTYYDPDDRVRRFGGAFTWRHLFVAARNLCSAVAAVHAQGHRVGDLRETNVLVAPNSLVTLIDCDSFQVAGDGETFHTRVGTEDHLPPELHGADLAHEDHDRTDADRFALAVLVFRFLMLGVHPFQAQGTRVPPSIGAKIVRGRFPYLRRTIGTVPPPYAPPFHALPRRLRKLFVRCFVHGRRRPHRRPAPEEWMAALAREIRELRRCAVNPNHWFAVRSCPWCEHAMRTGADPFPSAHGRQVAVTDLPEAVRRERLRTHLRMSLVDGRPDDDGLRRLAVRLGLGTKDVDTIVRQEGAGTPRTRTPVRGLAPVVLAAALASAVAPLLAAIAAVAVVTPAALTAVESLRDRRLLLVPYLFARNVHRSAVHLVTVAPYAAPGLVAGWLVGSELLWRGLAAAGTVAWGWSALWRPTDEGVRDRFVRGLSAMRALAASCGTCAALAAAAVWGPVVRWPL